MSSASIRVLHLTSSFPRWPADPIAPWLLDLARAEAAAGMDVHVLAPHGPGLPHQERWGGVAVSRFRYGPPGLERLAYRGGMLSEARSGWGSTALVPGLVSAFTAAALAAARRLHPDIIHAHWWFPAGLAAAAASPATGVPWVLTLHGSDVYLAGRPGWGAPGRAVLGRADAVVAVSATLAAEAARVWGVPVSRIGVARMPVAVPASDLLATPMPVAPPIRLAFVGRLVPEKGLDVLLGAMSLLLQRGVDVQLVVVGGGPLEAELKARVGPSAWSGSEVGGSAGSGSAGSGAAGSGSAGSGSEVGGSAGSGSAGSGSAGSGSAGSGSAGAGSEVGGSAGSGSAGSAGSGSAGSGSAGAGAAAGGSAGGLGSRVSWVGAVRPDEVGAYLVAAHALVVPSRREGLGLVALEALAHGRPVVASRVGGLVEVLQDSADGLLVGPGDECALADALMRLPLPAPTAAVLGGHRPEAVASEHLHLYSSLILKPRRR